MLVSLYKRWFKKTWWGSIELKALCEAPKSVVLIHQQRALFTINGRKILGNFDDAMGVITHKIYTTIFVHKSSLLFIWSLFLIFLCSTLTFSASAARHFVVWTIKNMVFFMGIDWNMFRARFYFAQVKTCSAQKSIA